ncbi:MAG: Cof-type HAD-IIB family hydrolase [Ruminococcus sp.]|nr:Cof-type HAD-IIB family hydrolase [Ruminococcus sp.]
MQSVIFFDIDGTLITEDARHLIPDSTRKALELVRANGHLTFINTGRTTFNVRPQVRELGFDGLICGCGTYIEFGGEVLLYNHLSQEHCRRTAAAVRECGVTPVYEHKDGYFFDRLAVRNADLEDFLVSFVEEGIPVDRDISEPEFIYDKFVVWENPHADMERFRRVISRDYDMIDRGNGFWENVPRGFSKATAMDFILAKLGIPRENAYAIGDSMNDLPMLQAVEHSIAMGGAEVIYPYVSYVTTPIEEDGIYNALAHFGLLQGSAPTSR